MCTYFCSSRCKSLFLIVDAFAVVLELASLFFSNMHVSHSENLDA